LTTSLTSICDKCDSKSIEYLEFLNEPNWLICENINQSDIVTIDSLIKEIKIANNSKYKLLCCVCSIKEGHFLGLYYIYNKFYLFDDLLSQNGLVETSNSFLFKPNSFIFVKNLE
jgi:hypothetical protein